MQPSILAGDSQELATATLSCIGDGVISTDINGNIVYINQKAEEITGIKLKDASGKHFDEVFVFYNAETKNNLRSPLVEVLINKKITGLENNTVILSRDNKEKYVSATCSPVNNAEDIMIGVVVILRDITRLKSLEIERLAEENNLKTIVNNAPVGMVTLNEESIITHINSAALLFASKDRDEILGKHFGESFCCSGCWDKENYCGYGSECQICVLNDALDAAIKTGLPTSNIEFSKTLYLNDKWQIFWFQSSVTPIIADGIRKLIFTFMDITEQKNHEMQVIKSRDEINNILNQIPSIVWKTDDKYAISYINNRWIEFVGESYDEIKEYKWTEVIWTEDLINKKEIIIDTISKRKLLQAELRVRRYDGVYRWCDITGTPYYDCEGQFSGYIGLLYDITERKEAEEVLKRYHMLSENTRDIILFFDSDGRILEANQAAVMAYGYSYEELCSLNVSSIKDGKNVTLDPKYEAEKSGSYFEAVHIRKDGSVFPVEVSTQGTEIGGNRIILSIIRDITERKKSDKRIFESQTKYHSLIMNMNSAYAYYKVIYNNDQQPVNLIFIEVNETFEKYFNETKRHIIGKNYADVFNDNNYMIENVRLNLYKLSRGESVNIPEIYLDDYDRWITISLYSPKRNEIVTIITDITYLKNSEMHLKAAKEAAEAANKAKSEFLANMSHEIRTPLNGIVGMVDLTLLTDLKEEQKDNLITAKACSNSLLNIINDVLDFSKMEVGKLVIENINFNIKELVEEIIRTHSPRVEEKGLELNYTFSSSIPEFLLGDPNRIRQILNNLISNALKFTETGAISITVKKLTSDEKGVELKFAVSDTGIGIDQKDVGRLFHSFSQIENITSKKYGGTGLGLAISKQLVEIMGGKIGVVSEKGKGSTFYFILKLEKGYCTEERISLIPHVQKTLRPLRLLMAEDDLINQKVIMKMLKEKGHYVEVANNGREALELYDERKFDVILMDIQMPEMNGIEAAQNIRKKETSGRHTPIVALTAYALNGDRERFLSLGMDAYITKPINMDELFATLEFISNKNDIEKENVPDKVILTESGDVLFLSKQSRQQGVEITPILDEITDDMLQMQTAMDTNNLLIIESMAHDIKIKAGEIDADEIKDTAFKIEISARRGNLTEVKNHIDKMGIYLKIFKESLI